jgi:putative transcriptional regulator
MTQRDTEKTNFLQGKLLIAMPGMGDPRFEKSVVFMCAHSEEGAMGIIVNKPIEQLRFREMVERLDLNLNDKTPDMPVLFGGPVENSRGFVLHSPDYKAEDATVSVLTDVSLTGTMDILRELAGGAGPAKALFALGYAGWGPGQIESEIRLNGWVHCDADGTIVFDTNLDGKWRNALLRLGIDVTLLSSQAGRA